MLRQTRDVSDVPVTRYARVAGDVSVAYQVTGEGSSDLVLGPGIVSHLEAFYDIPGYRRFIDRLGTFARVTTFDKLGNGLSDRIAGVRTIEERADDFLAVLDAASVERATVMGWSEGGPLSVLLAAAHPDRVERLVLFSTFPRGVIRADRPGLMSSEVSDTLVATIGEHWGEGIILLSYAPSLGAAPETLESLGRVERLSCTPTGLQALFQMMHDIDVTDALGSIQAPTLVLHRRHDFVPFECAQFLAEHIPGASLILVDGNEHYPCLGDVDPVVAELQQFMTGTRARFDDDHDRVLATVLFTDIVDSTRTASKLGDRRWRDLLDAHDDLTARTVERFRGRVVKSTGDGALATFDGPARAIRCALALCGGAQGLGLALRAGIHVGEIELRGSDVGGIAVNVAARIEALADPGEVLVSRTVTDLVAGSGLAFLDRAESELKGVPGTWALFSVIDAIA